MARIHYRIEQTARKVVIGGPTEGSIKAPFSMAALDQAIAEELEAVRRTNDGVAYPTDEDRIVILLAEMVGELDQDGRDDTFYLSRVVPEALVCEYGTDGLACQAFVLRQAALEYAERIPRLVAFVQALPDDRLIVDDKLAYYVTLPEHTADGAGAVYWKHAAVASLTVHRIPWTHPDLVERCCYLTAEAERRSQENHRQYLAERAAQEAAIVAKNEAKEAACRQKQATRLGVLTAILDPLDRERLDAGMLSDSEARGILMDRLVAERLPGLSHLAAKRGKLQSVACEAMDRDTWLRYRLAKQMIEDMPLTEDVTLEYEPRIVTEVDDKDVIGKPIVGIRIELTVGDWTEIRRLFFLPELPVQSVAL